MKAVGPLFSEIGTCAYVYSKKLHIISRNLHEALSEWFMELSLRALKLGRRDLSPTSFGRVPVGLS